MFLSGIVYAISAKNEVQELKQQSMQNRQELTNLQEIVDYYQCKTEETLKVKSTTNDHKPTKKPTKRAHKTMNLNGFSIAGDVDRWLNNKLYSALSKYEGPKALITSMKRSKAKWAHSLHSKGLAVDIRLDDAGSKMLEWLISPEGTAWLVDHKLDFFIEDKPGSNKLVPYKADQKYSDFVYENRSATGLHIHLYVDNS